MRDLPHSSPAHYRSRCSPYTQRILKPVSFPPDTREEQFRGVRDPQSQRCCGMPTSCPQIALKSDCGRGRCRAGHRHAWRRRLEGSRGRQRLHGSLAVWITQVVVQVQDFRCAVAHPRQRLAVSDLTVGAEAGEVMPERMQFVLLGVHLNLIRSSRTARLNTQTRPMDRLGTKWERHCPCKANVPSTQPQCDKSPSSFKRQVCSVSPM
jgi:hypothetical protein